MFGDDGFNEIMWGDEGDDEVLIGLSISLSDDRYTQIDLSDEGL